MSECNKAFWREIAANDYTPPGSPPLEVLTAELLSLLPATDPELREHFTYRIIVTWVRRGFYPPPALRDLVRRLTANFNVGLGERDTPTVFVRSFSALLLAEIVHADNREPCLDRVTAREIYDHVMAYLAAERDRRGYVPDLGWAHAIAHGADLLWVLAQSRFLDGDDLSRIIELIAELAVPPDEQIYRFNEDQRLIRAFIGALGRGLLPTELLRDWVARLATPAGSAVGYAKFFVGEPPPVAQARELARFHNTRQFLWACYFQLAHGDLLPDAAASLLSDVLAGVRSMNDQ